jgi:acyl-homoserine lactone acylase PvdQ
MVVSMADFDSMTQSIVPGVSGQMASKHYTDQIEDWVKTKPHPFAFSQDKVSMAAKHTLKLQPSL